MEQIIALIGMDIKRVNVIIFNMFKKANERLRMVSSKTEDIKKDPNQNSREEKLQCLK